MSKTSRRKFTSQFKAKVCVEALKQWQSIESLSKKYDLHPTQINAWKKGFLNNSPVVFEKEGKDNTTDTEQLIQRLYAQIGEQKVAIDFLKNTCCETT